eukprot:861693-Pleurochrysis_carterae.AAC.1
MALTSWLHGALQATLCFHNLTRWFHLGCMRKRPKVGTEVHCVRFLDNADRRIFDDWLGDEVAAFVRDNEPLPFDSRLAEPFPTPYNLHKVPKYKPVGSAVGDGAQAPGAMAPTGTVGSAAPSSVLAEASSTAGALGPRSVYARELAFPETRALGVLAGATDVLEHLPRLERADSTESVLIPLDDKRLRVTMSRRRKLRISFARREAPAAHPRTITSRMPRSVKLCGDEARLTLLHKRMRQARVVRLPGTPLRGGMRSSLISSHTRNLVTLLHRELSCRRHDVASAVISKLWS